MNTPLNRLMFDRSFNYMSQDLSNVSRDWNKASFFIHEAAELFYM
jgi:hypothetical protein